MELGTHCAATAAVARNAANNDSPFHGFQQTSPVLRGVKSAIHSPEGNIRMQQ